MAMLCTTLGSMPLQEAAKGLHAANEACETRQTGPKGLGLTVTTNKTLG